MEITSVLGRAGVRGLGGDSDLDPHDEDLKALWNLGNRIVKSEETVKQVIESAKRLGMKTYNLNDPIEAMAARQELIRVRKEREEKEVRKLCGICGCDACCHT